MLKKLIKFILPFIAFFITKTKISNFKSRLLDRMLDYSEGGKDE